MSQEEHPKTLEERAFALITHRASSYFDVFQIVKAVEKVAAANRAANMARHKAEQFLSNFGGS